MEPVNNAVFVVIPAFRVRAHILEVISGIGPEVSVILVVDDACPEGSGAWVEARCSDARVRVLRHAVNQGVGGAVLTGYRHALASGARIVVKLDGDGQMDPRLIPRLIRPIQDGKADYTKGNRFYSWESLQGMPLIRLLGNAALGFFSKAASGYYSIFDPTNGFTAIDARVIAALPLEKLQLRYFFESDLLFRLRTVGALVRDVPMNARYGDEKSSLSPIGSVFTFAFHHTINFAKRILYGYFIRDFSIASVELVLGTTFLLFGLGFGGWKWAESFRSEAFSSSGTVMLAALPIVLGMQMLIAFLSSDFQSEPERAVAEDLVPVVPLPQSVPAARLVTEPAT